MAHSIGNSMDITVGTNKGKIGANSVISISGSQSDTGSLCNTGGGSSSGCTDSGNAGDGSGGRGSNTGSLCNTGGETGGNSASGNTGNARGGNIVNIGIGTNMTIGGNAGDIGAKNSCNMSGGKGVRVDMGIISNMCGGSNTGCIGAGNNCNVMGVMTHMNIHTSHQWNPVQWLRIADTGFEANTGIEIKIDGGDGVRIGIGNIRNMTVGENAGGIGAGNNCNVSGGKGVEINIGNAANIGIGFNAGGIGAENNVNINQWNPC